MAAQADAGVWRKAAPAAVEGLATAAQAADVGAWQKAVPAAVEGRDQRCFGGAAHSVYRRVVLRVCPFAREPCMFGVAGVRGVRAYVYRHQPLSDATAWGMETCEISDFHGSELCEIRVFA